jgi:hypothetical protein
MTPLSDWPNVTAEQNKIVISSSRTQSTYDRESRAFRVQRQVGRLGAARDSAGFAKQVAEPERP